MNQQPEISHPENIDLDFQEVQAEQDIVTHFSYQEEIIEQKYNRPTEKKLYE